MTVRVILHLDLGQFNEQKSIYVNRFEPGACKSTIYRVRFSATTGNSFPLVQLGFCLPGSNGASRLLGSDRGCSGPTPAAIGPLVPCRDIPRDERPRWPGGEVGTMGRGEDIGDGSLDGGPQLEQLVHGRVGWGSVCGI